MQLSEKQKSFSIFFIFIFAFLKFRLNAEHFRKKETFITDLFLKLRTAQNVVN